MFRFGKLVSLAALTVLGSSSAFALIDVGTTDASDGAINVNSFENRVLALSEASPANWDAVSPVPGKGVYDNNVFAVVYKFSTLNIPLNASITFSNRANTCPVVIIVQGNATIDGTINLNSNGSQPGPGGFFGGAFGNTAGTILGSAGGGPGGGQPSSTNGVLAGSGSYSTFGTAGIGLGSLYGNDRIIPLIGGSGGGAYYQNSGQGGGGALLLVVRGTLTVNGSIQANAPSVSFNLYGAGSGGAIRFITETLAGTGNLQAISGGGNNTTGGQGRIRIEKINGALTGQSTAPIPSYGSVGVVAKLWPDNLDPSVSVVSVGSISAPTDPFGGLTAPDIELPSEGPFTVQAQAKNIPTNGTWSVVLRSNLRNGAAFETPMTFQSGNQLLSYWTTSLTFAEGLRTIQVRAFKP